MSGVHKQEVNEDDDGQRIDRWFFKRYPDIPKSHIFKLLRKGQIRVNSKRVKPQSRLGKGDIIRIPPLASETSGGRRKLPVSDADKKWLHSLILYQDEDVIIINKPAGLAVQGGSNIIRNLDAMLHVFEDESGVAPRLVHRLDKQTSGVMILARSARVARFLGDVFKKRQARKIYWALCSPAPKEDAGEIDHPLAQSHLSDKKKMVADVAEGKSAKTLYQIIEKAGHHYAFIGLWPRTGRMHQIRAHLSIIGSPIIGDDKYGGLKNIQDKFQLENNTDIQQRVFLHSRRLVCPHPSKTEHIDIAAPLSPPDQKIWELLGFDAESQEPDFSDIKL